MGKNKLWVRVAGGDGGEGGGAGQPDPLKHMRGIAITFVLGISKQQPTVSFSWEHSVINIKGDLVIRPWQ